MNENIYEVVIAILTLIILTLSFYIMSLMDGINVTFLEKEFSLLITFSVTILLLFFYKISKKNNDSVLYKGSFPSDKDLTYWILIVIIIAVFFFVGFQLEPEKINSKLSLASTILSIVLAIIAIIFSFIQSSHSSNQLEDISGKVSVIKNDLIVFTKSLESLEVIRDKIEMDNNNKINHFMELKKILEKRDLELRELRSVEDFNFFKDEVMKDVEAIIENHDIPATVTAWGPNALLNTIISNFGQMPIHIDTLWEKLIEDDEFLTKNELTRTLVKLEKEGRIKMTNKEVIYVV
ncbi:hypothetical protein SLU01_13060 [Sporosarcina luteola]|uniref:Uncharacterized protein n=1 Tax=Sporosarcina luteola TaxID=582850 RepID=A0A511Z6D7_9BACL|nr:hypothetical protein [Sporosarcina luteola]GEN82994.1 hypothetical protein SLU01_13060 [Sporosarcina luteola]